MKPLLILCVALVLSLSGCINARKATAYLDQHPEVATAYCADRFVSEPTTITETDTVEVVTEVPGPVLDCPETVHPVTGKKYIPTVQCPPGKLTTKTIRINTTNTVTNVARERQLGQQLDKERKEKADIRQGRNTWRGIAIVLGVVLAGVVVVLLLRR